MKEKQNIMKDLDQAIDTMNIDGIDCGLKALSSIETQPIQAENVKLFAARIKKINKENVKMIKPRKFLKAAVIAAAVMTMGLTAYAATSLNIFSFVQNNKFVTVRATDAEGNPISLEVQLNPSADHSSNNFITPIDTQKYTFDTAAQVRFKLDINLALPSAVANMELISATGQTLTYDDSESRNASLNYTDTQGHMLDITTTRLILDMSSNMAALTESEIMKGNVDYYKNNAGIDFTRFTEESKTTYLVALGEYTYSISLTGYSENEEKAIVDSIDFSDYN